MVAASQQKRVPQKRKGKAQNARGDHAADARADAQKVQAKAVSPGKDPVVAAVRKKGADYRNKKTAASRASAPSHKEHTGHTGMAGLSQRHTKSAPGGISRPANQSNGRPASRNIGRLSLRARRTLRDIARKIALPQLRKRIEEAADDLMRSVPFASLGAKARKWFWLRPHSLLRKAGIQWPRQFLGEIRTIFARITPKGLYARALIIIITPIVLLEGVVAFVFMERHWQAVTRRLSEATARDIAALIEVYKTYPGINDYSNLIDLARDQMNLSLRVLPPEKLPAPKPKPFFALLDRTLSNEIRKKIKHPFWIDTVGQSRHVEIRVKLDNAVLRFIALRSQTFASNSHIFLLWMVGTSVVLLSVAILFLSNQIKPILRLSEAAEAFGMGRPAPEDFRPRGAREVRQAAQAFIEMRDRIAMHVEQRTIMLAGVSHDLRTVLTRFKLELAMRADNPEFDAMRSDVSEMQDMLEDYLAFSKGDSGEAATPINMRELLEEIHEDSRQFDIPIELTMRKRRKDLVLTVKRNALKRALMNLISNAARFGTRITITMARQGKWLDIAVEDNGPGIPEQSREEVLTPFLRLDHARNQDKGNTGLGLSIARDIARSHGGDIILEESPELGGLKAILRLPL